MTKEQRDELIAYLRANNVDIREVMQNRQTGDGFRGQTLGRGVYVCLAGRSFPTCCWIPI